MAMEKEIPVYIFMGFLGAGKTKFAKETLMEQDFTEGQRNPASGGRRW